MILAEVAVEPTVFDDWKDFRYVFEKFGFDKGPLVSRFPKGWLRMALEHAGELRRSGSVTDLQYARIEESLRRYKHDRMTISSRQYDPRRSWQGNAVEQHSVTPFWLIIAHTGDPACAALRSIDEIDDKTFSALGEARIGRSAEHYAEAARLLVRNSREILFVDPYLSPSRKHVGALWRILENSRWEERGVSRVELHLRFDDRRSPSTDEFSVQCERAFSEWSLRYPGFRVFRWTHDRLPEDFHARYLLTDVGGIRFDRGFEEPNDVDERRAKVDVAVLSARVYGELWSYFQRNSSPLRLVDCWQVSKAT